MIALRSALALPFGFELEIDKGIALSSGMGGSAASCVAALVAANALLEAPLSRDQLYLHALDGEAVASGSRHGDNLGPMLWAAWCCPRWSGCAGAGAAAWHSLVVHPDAVLETRRARAALAGNYRLDEFVAQSANLALVLAGCHAGDESLVRAGLRDVLIEPRRAALILGFGAAKAAALAEGAMGAGISGAGPACLPGSPPARQPRRLRRGAGDIRRRRVGSQSWVSALNCPGARLL
ncbi:homoserine kinase [Xanthomonas oryzae]|uniref:homoserine kinase n=1 Tax=Xanthomonas oryzae TaxID=347 RepID=UPI001F5EE342|nr:homoserine kinase [Xanthomonas oryzae]